MLTYINIIFTILLLLPGFIALKIRQSTSEYKELSTFEYTTTSLGFSFLIFLLWIVLNYIIKIFFIPKYSFFQGLKNIIIKHKIEILFSNFTIFFILTYFISFIIFSLIIYNLHWLGLWHKILRKLDLVRFSPHLTPWEDFQILSKLDWIFVELKDGKSILGKLGFGSHLPFDKEVVLTRTKKSPIQIYENQELIDFGHDIEMTYINYSEISAMHSIKDKKIKEAKNSWKDYFSLFISLFLCCVFTVTQLICIIAKIDSYISYSLIFDILGTILIFSILIWNLKSLSRFN